jgi:predicted dithiol-disulfide oxidoreductase (DUF899 family)
MGWRFPWVQFLDLAPLGRNEDGLEFPQAWWRRHDEYPER